MFRDPSISVYTWLSVLLSLMERNAQGNESSSSFKLKYNTILHAFAILQILKSRKESIFLHYTHFIYVFSSKWTTQWPKHLRLILKYFVARWSSDSCKLKHGEEFKHMNAQRRECFIWLNWDSYKVRVAEGASLCPGQWDFQNTFIPRRYRDREETSDFRPRISDFWL